MSTNRDLLELNKNNNMTHILSFTVRVKNSLETLNSWTRYPLSRVKPVQNGHSKSDQKLIFKTNYRLMQVKSIAECSKESILQYLRPSLSTLCFDIFWWALKVLLNTAKTDLTGLVSILICFFVGRKDHFVGCCHEQAYTYSMTVILEFLDYIYLDTTVKEHQGNRPRIIL